MKLIHISLYVEVAGMILSDEIRYFGMREAFTRGLIKQDVCAFKSE